MRNTPFEQSICLLHKVLTWTVSQIGQMLVSKKLSKLENGFQRSRLGQLLSFKNVLDKILEELKNNYFPQDNLNT